MSSERADERTLEAERILEEAGIEASVEATGHTREIATVRAPYETATRLAELAPEIKALGFRYIALDLTHVEAGS